jgi:tRNA A37 threonylcarbamoyladenosine synthetase subunit TsaC/SUA5/YrdC
VSNSITAVNPENASSEGFPKDWGAGRPDIDRDIARLWDCLEQGGVVIVPTRGGYGFWAGSAEATQRIVDAKGRGPHKRMGLVLGSHDRDVFLLDQHKWDMIDCLAVDYGLPITIVARYNPDHPLMARVHNDPLLKKLCTARGTIAKGYNLHGREEDIVADLSFEQLRPITGSSANATGKGGKNRIEDIEPEVAACADLIIDYGERPSARPGRRRQGLRGTTIINFDTMELLRIGGPYSTIRSVLKLHFDWELPPDPGPEVLPTGHLHEFALANVE